MPRRSGCELVTAETATADGLSGIFLTGGLLRDSAVQAFWM